MGIFGNLFKKKNDMTLEELHEVNKNLEKKQ
jgi:hypothetical protein